MKSRSSKESELHFQKLSHILSTNNDYYIPIVVDLFNLLQTIIFFPTLFLLSLKVKAEKVAEWYSFIEWYYLLLLPQLIVLLEIIMYLKLSFANSVLLFSKRKCKCAHIKHRSSVIWILTVPQRERRWETYLSISYSASPHRESPAWDCYYAFVWLSQWLPMAWYLLFIIYYSKYIAYHLIILHMKKLKRQTDFNLETIYIHFLAGKKETDLSFLTIELCTSYHCF